MPKFSILIPAYKTTFLREAIESILCQTYEDFELIISDDCSPEPVRDIFEAFSSDSRIKYRRNPENIGGQKLVDHWNILLQEAEGEFVIVPGDDDVFEPNYLEEANRVIVKYPHVDLVRGRTRRIDKWGGVIEEDRDMCALQNQADFVESLFSFGTIHCMGNYVFKRKTLLANGGFVAFDLAWFSDDASAILYSENGVGNTDEIVFNFRVSEASISEAQDGRTVRMKNRAMCSFFLWCEGRTTLKRKDEVLSKIKEYCCNHHLLWSDNLTQMGLREILILEKTFLSWRLALCWLKRKMKNSLAASV